MVKFDKIKTTKAAEAATTRLTALEVICKPTISFEGVMKLYNFTLNLKLNRHKLTTLNNKNIYKNCGNLWSTKQSSEKFL